MTAGSHDSAILEHQSHLLEMMASGTPPDRILARLAESLESLMPGGRCSILLVDEDTRTLRHGAAPNLPVAYSAAIDGIAIGSSTGSCGAAAHLGRLIIARDTQTDPRWEAFRELAAAHGLRSCWSVPISAEDGAVLGTFAVYHDEPHEPTEREIALLARFGALSAIAIRHATMLRELATSEERFRRAFEDNVAGMALVDLDGVLVRVNPALCSVMACPAGALLGRRFADLVHVDDREPVAGALDRLLGGGTDGVQLDVRVPRGGDGGEASALLTMSLVRGPDGAPLRGCVNLIDETERRLADADRRAAEAARAVAEERSRAKGQLLSAMSHELRTPMSSIVGFSELLRTVDLPPERRDRAVTHMAEAAQHILDLVEDLLDLAKLDAGAVRMRPAPIDPGSVLEEVLAVLEPLAEQHRVDVRFDGTAVTVLADRRRLRQALLNLVANAIEYNHAGGQVRLAIAEGDPVIISVEDSGPGLPTAEADRVFAPFDRLGAEHGNVPGTGLGLTVSKQFVEAMGGRVSIRSGEREGTAVEVELPAAMAAREAV